MDIGDIFAILPQQIVFGLALGAVYALLAVGYTMVYGVLFMINFAHGDVLMIGSMAGWAILTGAIIAMPGAPLIVLILAVVVGALLAALWGWASSGSRTAPCTREAARASVRSSARWASRWSCRTRRSW